MNSKSLRTKILLAFLLVCWVFVSGSVVIYYQVGIARAAMVDSSVRAADMETVMTLKSLIGVMYGYQADLIINGSMDSIKEYKEKIALFSGLVAKAVNEAAADSQRIVSSIRGVGNLSRDAAAESQNVSAATEEQSASMEEIAASSQALAKLAQELQTAVAKFRI